LSAVDPNGTDVSSAVQLGTIITAADAAVGGTIVIGGAGLLGTAYGAYDIGTRGIPEIQQSWGILTGPQGIFGPNGPLANLAPVPPIRSWELPQNVFPPFVIWPGQSWSSFKGPNGSARCRAACSAVAQALCMFGVPSDVAFAAGAACIAKCPGPGNDGGGGTPCPAPPLRPAM